MHIHRYPNGAEYAGEWRENKKDGFGVYKFRDGGAYEGEWADGQREGVGVRTFASGKVKVHWPLQGTVSNAFPPVDAW